MLQPRSVHLLSGWGGARAVIVRFTGADWEFPGANRAQPHARVQLPNKKSRLAFLDLHPDAVARVPAVSFFSRRCIRRLCANRKPSRGHAPVDWTMTPQAITLRASSLRRRNRRPSQTLICLLGVVRYSTRRLRWIEFSSAGMLFQLKVIDFGYGIDSEWL